MRSQARGFTWDDFVICYTHEQPRSVQSMMFNLLKYGTRIITEINDWCQARNVQVNIEAGADGKVTKPKLACCSNARIWLKCAGCRGNPCTCTGIPCILKRFLWEDLVDFADVGREDTADVWQTYMLFQEVVQLPYPTASERRLIVTRGFNCFRRT
jgi:hypothetical protein